MSKSRGTGISPLRYLELGMNPEWLRYYIAAKLNANVEDLDFNPDDFIARVNSDLVGKYVNIASRAAGFINAHFDGRARLLGRRRSAGRQSAAAPRLNFVRDAYEAREFGKAMRETMQHRRPASTRNSTSGKPWNLAKDRRRRCGAAGRLLAGSAWLPAADGPARAGAAAAACRVARELFGLERDFMWADADVLPAAHRAVSAI